MNEKIDVLLATYNGEKFLKQQIDSILNQTYKNINLIISDDCSKDRTCEILKEYEKADERITVFYQQKNLGYVKNFEFLLRQVKSEFYMLSDQDDFWLPEKIEKSMKTLKEENADLVFGDLEIVDENSNEIHPSFNDFMKLSRKIKKYIGSYKVNYLYNCITGCTVLSKSKYINKLLPVPVKSKYVIHDHWLGIILSLNGKLAYMPGKYIKYRQHGNNQVGVDKISHKFKKLEDVRELFINVKLGVFNTYVENSKSFPEPIQELNLEALNYFKDIEKKKNVNFKNWKTFHRLYKTETLIYYIENFIIMNIPIIAKCLFKIRYTILKILKKR